jgi:hypothetical protein
VKLEKVGALVVAVQGVGSVLVAEERRSGWREVIYESWYEVSSNDVLDYG